MKTYNFFPLILLLLVMSYSFGFAQGNITVIAPTSEIAEGLDLEAVGELFSEADNLEAFEKVLNDPDVGINNLDLNDDGFVDYIRVVEDMVDDVHLIILQVPLGENEFQDVATIEVERTDDDGYNMQIRGNEVIYGPDYYVAPRYVHIHTWPIIIWIYRPVYTPYRSVYYYGYYPHWYRTYHPVPHKVYYTRTHHYRSRTTFVVTQRNHVRSVEKVKYVPRNSSVVKKTTPTRRTTVQPSRVEKQRTINKSSRGSITDKPVNRTVKSRPQKTEERKVIQRTPTKSVKKSTQTNDVKKVTRPKTEAKKVEKKKEPTKNTSKKESKNSNAEKGSLKSSVEKKKFN